MKNILCFGGSITYGAGDSQGGWVSRLRQQLERDSKSKPPLVYTLGVSGDTTSDLRKRLLEEAKVRIAQERESNCIIFGIGGNDAAFILNENRFVVEIKEFESNMDYLITEAKKLASKVIVISLTPVRDEITRNRPGKDKAKLNEYQKSYNECLVKISIRCEVNYVNINSPYLTDLETYISQDGVHPTDEGHRLIAAVVHRCLL
jgi:lysophospholipase L1-like esterase